MTSKIYSASGGSSLFSFVCVDVLWSDDLTNVLPLVETGQHDLAMSFFQASPSLFAEGVGATVATYSGFVFR